MEKLLELKSLVEHLSHGTSNDKRINESMNLLDQDIKKSLEILKIIPNYENEEEVYSAVRDGASSYLEDGLNYQSFINTLALIKKHLHLLQDNGSHEYVNRMSFELARIFSRLQVNPQQKVKQMLRNKRISKLVGMIGPYVLGVATGVGLTLILNS